MSIRWIRNLLIDGEKNTLEIQLGEKFIGDKCYTRFGKDVEQWFQVRSGVREEVLASGIEVFRKRLASASITYPDGRPYDWK